MIYIRSIKNNADNQFDNAKEFEKHNLMPYAGDARTDDLIANHIVDVLAHFSSDFGINESIEKIRSIKCENGSRVFGEGVNV